ncbi:TerB family tellurite resistance protein [Allohahella marinimesophila]
MLTKFLDALRGANHADTTEQKHSLEVLTAAMLYQVARVDMDIDAAELARIRSFVDNTFSLGAGELEQCMDEAASLADNATSLFELTSELNAALEATDRFRIIENMWLVALADGEIDKYEEQVIRRSAELLYVHHGEFIRARHAAEARAST